MPLTGIIAGRSRAAIVSVAMATVLGQNISLSLAQLLCPATMPSAAGALSVLLSTASDESTGFVTLMILMRMKTQHF